MTPNIASKSTYRVNGRNIRIEVVSGLNTEQTSPKHAVPTAGDNDMLNFTANLEASIIEFAS